MLVTVLTIGAVACGPDPKPKLAQGPQPYLIVRVRSADGKPLLVGTIAPDIRFEYSGESRDHRDGFAFHGSLLENTSAGFRIHWQAVRRAGGHEIRTIDEEEFAPWGAETKLHSLDDYRVSVFYAPKPADQYFASGDLAK